MRQVVYVFEEDKTPSCKTASMILIQMYRRECRKALKNNACPYSEEEFGLFMLVHASVDLQHILIAYLALECSNIFKADKYPF